MVKATRGLKRITPHLTFSGGSYEADYPVGNLKTLPLSKVARTSDLQLTSTKFQASSATAYAGQLSIIYRHNLSREGLIRRRYYSGENLAGDLLHDSGWLPWLESVYTEDQVDWDGGNWWDRTYTDDELENTAWHHPYYTEEKLYWKSVLVEFDDQNNAAGYLEIGLAEFETAVEFPVNFSFGAEYGFESRTLVEEAEGGAQYFERRNKPRIFRGEVNYTLNDDAKGVFLESQRQDDLDGVFFWWPDRENSLHLLRDSFLARNVELGPLSYAAAQRSRVPIYYREVLG